MQFKKFAFLIHPRQDLRADMGLFRTSYGLIPSFAWSAAFQHMDVKPLITGQIAFTGAPDSITGSIVTVPLSPVQLLTMPRAKVKAKLCAAVDVARGLGAEVIGLGALTAPAAAGGRSLTHYQDVALTNGNAFTAMITMMGMERLLARLGPEPLIAIVGATGSVGGCLTRLFAKRHGGRLLLVGRNRGRLDRLASEIHHDSVSVEIGTDMSDVARADLVVLLTSASEALLRGEHLKAGAIVLDGTVPRNTDPGLLRTRPDVLIVDGGLVDIPGFNVRGPIGLPPGLAYACLAETMLLALSGHAGHFSIGNPSVGQAEYMLELAGRFREFGFTLAPFRSFGRLVDPSVHAADTILEHLACAA